jgi:hypothetical protein
MCCSFVFVSNRLKLLALLPELLPLIQLVKDAQCGRDGNGCFPFVNSQVQLELPVRARILFLSCYVVSLKCIEMC